MEYQEMINLLDNTSNQPSNFRIKKIGLKWMMNQKEHTILIAKLNLKLQC